MTSYTTTTTRTAGQTLNATIWNALANNDTHFSEILTYTPTLTQSVTVSKTVNTASYWQAGKRVHVTLFLTASSTGTSGNAILVSLPVTSVSYQAYHVLGSGFIQDTGTAWYQGAVCFNSTTTVAIRRSGDAGFVGITPAFAMVSTDQVSMSFDYQAA